MATLRVYAELNDFLPEPARQRDLDVPVAPGTPVAGVLAALGVPDGRVDMVLIDGRPGSLSQVLEGGERVVAYPVFEAFDISGAGPLPDRPLRRTRFSADEHLARLARYLRLAGFDTLLEPGLEDHDLVARAEAAGRILLTRDRELVTRYRPSRQLSPLSERPREQFLEVVGRLQLEASARPFTRCMVCNTELQALPGAAARERVPGSVARDHTCFLGCPGCGRVYWPGSHHRRMSRLLADAGIPVS